MDLAGLVIRGLGSDPRLGARAFDGSRAGDPAAPATIVIRNRDALARVATHPGELGFVRAFVAGDLDVEGDLKVVLDAAARISHVGFTPRDWAALVRVAGSGALRRLPPPPEESHLSGWRHSRGRDRQAIHHHYDVGNDFYRLVLGPSLTYSCAVWTDPSITLEEAQSNKYELISTKLGLADGMRLLDVGCGWGGMLLHAAEHHGARGVGVSLSDAQVELGAKRIAEAGLSDRLEVRVQDYRDVHDGPFDAISSIGMFEHVGRHHFEQYARNLHALLRPGGRLLNHAISRPAEPAPPAHRSEELTVRARRVANAAGSRQFTRIRSPFMQRYVFPDGELLEVGTVVSVLQDLGFEVRHVESLREHYALTLDRWVANLEASWDEAVKLVGEGRARVWRLYMSASALGFEAGRLNVHQVLAVKNEAGRSNLPLRPRFAP